MHKSVRGLREFFRPCRRRLGSMRFPFSIFYPLSALAAAVLRRVHPRFLSDGGGEEASRVLFDKNHRSSLLVRLADKQPATTLKPEA